jgi:hypothetical protein
MSLAGLPPRTKIWASNPAASRDIATPSDGQISTGYAGTPAPVYQFVNWMFKKYDQLLLYLFKRGIPDWDPEQAYGVGDIVQVDNGTTYQCWSGSTNNEPPDPTHWIRWGYNSDQIEIAADARIALAVSASIAAATITAGSGSISNATMIKIGLVKEVSFLWTGTTDSSGLKTVGITLSDGAAFATSGETVQVSFSYLSTFIALDTVAGKMNGANGVTLEISSAAQPAQAVAVNVSVRGY